MARLRARATACILLAITAHDNFATGLTVKRASPDAQLTGPIERVMAEGRHINETMHLRQLDIRADEESDPETSWSRLVDRLISPFPLSSAGEELVQTPEVPERGGGGSLHPEAEPEQQSDHESNPGSAIGSQSGSPAGSALEAPAVPGSGSPASANSLGQGDVDMSKSASPLDGRPWIDAAEPAELKGAAIIGRTLALLVETDINGMTNMMTAWKGADPLGVFKSRRDIRSPWQRPLAAWNSPYLSGWEVCDYDDKQPFRDSWPALERAMRALNVGGPSNDYAHHHWLIPRHVNPGLLSQAGTPSAGPNIARALRQNEFMTYRQENKLSAKLQPTFAYHMNVINIVDGIIVVQNGESLFHKLEQRNGRKPMPSQFPVAVHWSDLMWSVWARLHREMRTGSEGRLSTENTQWRSLGTVPPNLPPQVKLRDKLSQTLWPGTEIMLQVKELPEMMDWLNFIIIQSMPSQEASKIVTSCLKARGWHPNDRSPFGPLWGQHETYPVGHWCFYALLSLPMNKSVAFFLAQHKSPDTLGLKTLKSVTIFYGDPPSGTPNPTVQQLSMVKLPTLLWEIVDTSQQVKDLRTQYETMPGGYMWAGWSNNPSAQPYLRYGASITQSAPGSNTGGGAAAGPSNQQGPAGPANNAAGLPGQQANTQQNPAPPVNLFAAFANPGAPAGSAPANSHQQQWTAPGNPNAGPSNQQQ